MLDKDFNHYFEKAHNQRTFFEAGGQNKDFLKEILDMMKDPDDSFSWDPDETQFNFRLQISNDFMRRTGFEMDNAEDIGDFVVGILDSDKEKTEKALGDAIGLPTLSNYQWGVSNITDDNEPDEDGTFEIVINLYTNVPADFLSE